MKKYFYWSWFESDAKHMQILSTVLLIGYGFLLPLQVLLFVTGAEIPLHKVLITAVCTYVSAAYWYTVRTYTKERNNDA